MAIFWDQYEDGYEAPDYPPEVYDSLLLARKRVPGCKVDVRGVHKKRLELSKKSGGDGATVIDRGFEPAKIDITITIATKSQLELLEALEEELVRKAGKPSKQKRKSGQKGETKIEGAVEFASPRLRRIHHIIIESVSGLEPGQDRGTWVKKITAVEYVRPTPVNATSKAEGAAPRVKLAPGLPVPKSQRGPTPAETEALPQLPPTPEQGGT